MLSQLSSQSNDLSLPHSFLLSPQSPTTESHSVTQTINGAELFSVSSDVPKAPQYLNTPQGEVLVFCHESITIYLYFYRTWWRRSAPTHLLPTHLGVTTNASLSSKQLLISPTSGCSLLGFINDNTIYWAPSWVRLTLSYCFFFTWLIHTHLWRLRLASSTPGSPLPSRDPFQAPMAFFIITPYLDWVTKVEVPCLSVSMTSHSDCKL